MNSKEEIYRSFNIRKPTFGQLRPAKIQISLCVWVWFEPSFSVWCNFASLAVQSALSEHLDQPALRAGWPECSLGAFLKVRFLTLRHIVYFIGWLRKTDGLSAMYSRVNNLRHQYGDMHMAATVSFVRIYA